MVECERDQIFMWCLEGLRRLLYQDFQFTISHHAQNNLEEAMREANPVLDFLESDGYILYDSQGHITSADLFEIYKKYCEDNALAEPNKRTAQKRLKDALQKRGITPVTHVPQYGSRSIRGYQGIRLLQSVRWIA